MNALSNKTILITGASSGIGLACAHRFATAGAQLLLCARRTDILNTLAQQLASDYHAKTHVFHCDIRNQTQMKNALDTLPDEWKTIDVLINNAGLAAGIDTIQDSHTQDWEDMIDTNIKGLLYMTREILPQMVARKSGHIINLCSISGHQIYPKGVVYCATKHAVAALSLGLRMDLLGTHVRVSMVSPGAVETEFSLVRLKGDETRAHAVYEGWNPLQADDIADAIFYCATRPEHVNINEIIIMPTQQAAVGMIAK